jgi:hypothetical protein
VNRPKGREVQDMIGQAARVLPHSRSWLGASVLLIGCLLVGTPALAVSLRIERGDYMGPYDFAGQRYTADASFDVPPDTELVVTNAVAEIARFRVDSSGSVTVVAGESRVEAATGLLRFRNVPVRVERGEYLGSHDLVGRFQADTTEIVVPDVDFHVTNSSRSIARFRVASNGSVTLVAGDTSVDVSTVVLPAGSAVSRPDRSTYPLAADAAAGLVRFRNVPVRVERGEYLGSHDFVGRFQADVTQIVVPDVEFLVTNSSRPIAAFKVAANGSVTLVDGASSVDVSAISLPAGSPISRPDRSTYPLAADAAAGLVRFRNVPIRIERGGYAGPHDLLGRFHADVTQIVVPDVEFQVTNASRSIAAFKVAANGSVTLVDGASSVDVSTVSLPAGSPISRPDLSTYPLAASAAAGLLVFRNATVQVDPDCAASYDLVGRFSGSHAFVLVPDVWFRLSDPAGPTIATFRVHDGQIAIEGDPVLANPIAVSSFVGGVPCTFRLSTTTTVAPTAVAGADQAVPEGTMVSLDGSASSGTDLSFTWEQLAGPPVTLSGPDTATPSFTAPLLLGGFGSQTLTFALTVENGAGSSTDVVDITVTNVNHAPVAQAGTGQTVQEGAPVALDGTASFDPDTDPILAYQWVQTGGLDTPVILSSASVARPTFIAPVLAGGVGGTAVLTFALAVSDGALWSSADEVQVTVEQVNHAPVADAGSPQTVHSGRSVILAGGALDPDGDSIAGFQWTQIGGPAVQLEHGATATASFVAPAVSGTVDLAFQLTATDGDLTSDPATVVVTVKNGPPACAAARPVPGLLWPPDHRMVPVSIQGVTDPDDGTVVLTIVAVTQDEPVNGLGDGDTSPDAVRQGPRLLLRAERAGAGNGRVYVLQFTADDGQGGTCAGRVTVEVPHSMKRNAPALDDGQLFDATRP